MNRLKNIAIVFALVTIFIACSKKRETPSLPLLLSDGNTLTLNGLTGSEDGKAAGNSVFVDLSSGKQTLVLRSSWDLGFYGGKDFKVIINNTTGAGAKVMEANNLEEVNEADVKGLELAVSQASPSSKHFDYFDDVTGSFTKTVIPSISADAANNKVIVLNPGKGGSAPERDWVKFKITINESGGYAVQYGSIKQTSGFKSVDVVKDPNYNFKYFSFVSGSVVAGQPVKNEWDFVWGNSVYQTKMGENWVPYNFSDMVFINVLAGVQAAEVLNADFNYDKISKANLNDGKIKFSSAGDAIGSKWRKVPGVGIITDRFYLIKDPSGNVYKLKFISMGVGGDGGTRGKPVIEYKLIE